MQIYTALPEACVRRQLPVMRTSLTRIFSGAYHASHVQSEEVLSSDRDIEVMATASDPYIAAGKILHEVPDVITLDIEMPRMDGITFLQKIMSQHPIPVVICSGLTEAGSETAIKALEYGAIVIILKPRVGTKAFLEESQVRICDAVKAASQAKVRKAVPPARPVVPKLSADVILAKPTSKAMDKTTEKVLWSVPPPAVPRP